MPNTNEPIDYAAIIAAHPDAAADVLAAADAVASAMQHGPVSGLVLLRLGLAWRAARLLTETEPAAACTTGDR